MIKNFPGVRLEMTHIHHLRPGTVLLNPEISDKWDLFEKMVDAFVSSGSIAPSQRSATLEALVAREKTLTRQLWPVQTRVASTWGNGIFVVLI